MFIINIYHKCIFCRQGPVSNHKNINDKVLLNGSNGGRMDHLGAAKSFQKRGSRGVKHLPFRGGQILPKEGEQGCKTFTFQGRPNLDKRGGAGV